MSDCNFTVNIQDSECIGASLVKINSNFSNLDDVTCSLQASLNALLAGTASSSANIRLSLSNSTATPTINIGSNVVYLHAFNGNTVSLWDAVLNKWVVRTVPNVTGFPLTGLLPNTNYDIYLFFDGTGLRLEFVAWGNNDPGSLPPAVGKQDGVFVKVGEPTKRLIGCLRTTAANTTEVTFGRTAVLGGSHPKIFLHNIYNQQPISFSIIDTGPSQLPTNNIRYWQTTSNGDTGNANGPFERFGGSSNNKVSFISRSTETVTLNTISYLLDNIATYYGYALNKETPTVAQLLADTPGTPIYEEASGAGSLTHAYSNTIVAGYHYLQVVSMTYENQLQRYLTWTGDRHSYGVFGTLAAY